MSVTASIADNRLIVSVADTGIGLGDAPGQGIGLSNIRERLALLFRRRAYLALEANEPRGFIARIVLPDVPCRDIAAPAASGSTSDA